MVGKIRVENPFFEDRKYGNILDFIGNTPLVPINRVNPDNEANWLAHYWGTAQEIWEQTNGAVSAVVATMGTGGILDAAMDNDLNISMALAALFGFMKKANPMVDMQALDAADIERDLLLNRHIVILDTHVGPIWNRMHG